MATSYGSSKNKNDYTSQTPTSDAKTGVQGSERNKSRLSGGFGLGSYRYSAPIGPMNRGNITGGQGIAGMKDVRLRPTAGAPKATVSGKPVAPKPKAKPAVRKPMEITIPGGVRPAAKAAAKPAAKKATNTGVGFTTGSRTGSSATKSGTSPRGTVSQSRLQSRAGMEKGGVAGPSKNAAGKNASSMTGKKK